MIKRIFVLLLSLILITGCSLTLKKESKLDGLNVKMMENDEFTYEGIIDPSAALKWEVVKEEVYFDKKSGKLYTRTVNPSQDDEVKTVAFCFVVIPVSNTEGIDYEHTFLKWYAYKVNKIMNYYHVDKDGNYWLWF